MPTSGKIFLRCIRAFHYWQHHNERISLGLVLLGGIVYLLHVAGLTTGTWVRLPMEWEHDLSHISTLLFGFYLLLIVVAKVAARLWPPPIVPIITSMPDSRERSSTGTWLFTDAQGSKYRFRYADGGDLPVFSALAMADPAIVTTYSYLSEAKWEELYARWQAADAQALMVLERHEDERMKWRVVAVSIVVPLSLEGARDLWNGSIGTVEINKSNMAFSTHKPTALLLDLVAADRHNTVGTPELVFALPKVHLSKMLARWPRRKLEIWIEPVHRALPNILHQMGFEGPHKTGEGLTLYKLEIPPIGVLLSDKQKETKSKLLLNLKECAKWQIADH